MNTVTGWRYYYRRYLFWLPVQFCMVCGKMFWSGPTMWPSDYCSGDCAEEDYKTMD